jgi:hypothetical protein
MANLCRTSLVRTFCETEVLLDYPGMKFSNPNTLECRSLAANVSKIRQIYCEIKYVYVQTDRHNLLATRLYYTLCEKQRMESAHFNLTTDILRKCKYYEHLNIL